MTTPAEPTPTPAAPAPAPAQEPTTPQPSWDDMFQGEDPTEVKKALENSRKWEERAKQNKAKADEFEKFRQASLTEQERAVEAARTEAANETTLKFAGRLVDAEFRAAASGRLEPEQVKALLENLDRTRFLTEDGDVDRKALSAWVDLIAPTTASAPPDLGQGARGVAAAGVDMNQILRSAAGRS